MAEREALSWPAAGGTAADNDKSSVHDDRTAVILVMDRQSRDLWTIVDLLFRESLGPQLLSGVLLRSV
jgi:hypothetical protein